VILAMFAAASWLAQSGCGRIEEAESRRVTVGNGFMEVSEAPKVFICGVERGEEVRGVVTFEVRTTCAGDGNTVDVFLDGQRVGNSRIGEKVFVRFDTRRISQGDHLLAATVRDKYRRTAIGQVRFRVKNGANGFPEIEAEGGPLFVAPGDEIGLPFFLSDPDGDPIDWTASVTMSDGFLRTTSGRVTGRGRIELRCQAGSRGPAEVVLSVRDDHGGDNFRRVKFEVQ